MKKILSILLVAGITALVACGPSADEKARMDKERQDSIARVQKAYDDSLETANKMAADKIKQDSIATADMDKARKDSVEAASKKKSPVKTKKTTTTVKPGQPLPGRPGAVKK